jgi:fructose-1-phosphate kinase PfkB-like protein
MPLLLAAEDVVARGETLMDPIEDALAEALEDPVEILAPGRRELEALVLDTCDAEELRAESLKAVMKLLLGAVNRVPGICFK